MARRSQSEELRQLQELAEQHGIAWQDAREYADSRHKVARHILLSAGFHPAIPTPTETSKLELLSVLSTTLQTNDALRQENYRLRQRLEPVRRISKEAAAKKTEVVALLWSAWKMALGGYRFTEAELHNITDTVAGYWYGQKRKAADTRGKKTAPARKSTTDV